MLWKYGFVVCLLAFLGGCEFYRQRTALLEREERGPIWDLEFQIGAASEPNNRVPDSGRVAFFLDDAHIEGVELVEGRHFKANLGAVLGHPDSESELFLVWKDSTSIGERVVSAAYSYLFRTEDRVWHASGERKNAYYDRDRGQWSFPLLSESVSSDRVIHRFEVRLDFSDGSCKDVIFDFEWSVQTLPLHVEIEEVPWRPLQQDQRIEWAKLHIQNPYVRRKLALQLEVEGEWKMRQKLKHRWYTLETHLGPLPAPYEVEDVLLVELLRHSFGATLRKEGHPEQLLAMQSGTFEFQVEPGGRVDVVLWLQPLSRACEHFEVERMRERSFQMWGRRVRAREVELRFADHWAVQGASWLGRVSLRLLGVGQEKVYFEEANRVFQGSIGRVGRIWEDRVNPLQECGGWVHLLRGIAPY